MHGNAVNEAKMGVFNMTTFILQHRFLVIYFRIVLQAS